LDTRRWQDQLELQEGVALDQFPGPPFLLDAEAGKLDDQTVTSHLLDRRLRHAELIDAGTEDPFRPVDVVCSG
jgi:hypothetical protein